MKKQLFTAALVLTVVMLAAVSASALTPEESSRALMEAKTLDRQLEILHSFARENAAALEAGGWEYDLDVRLAPGLPEGILPSDWDQFQYTNADAFPPELRGHRMIVIDATKDERPVLAANLMARFPAGMIAESVDTAEYALVIRYVMTPSNYSYTIQVKSYHRDYAAYVINMRTGEAVCFWTHRNTAYSSGRISELNGDLFTPEQLWYCLRAQIWEEIRYVQEDGTVLLVGISGGNRYLKGYEGAPGEIDVPGTVDGYPVVEIAAKCFRGCQTLKHVTLAAGIIQISDEAFMSCYQLESVTLPDTLVRISKWGFRECNSLKSISFPEGLVEIGEEAFLWAYSLPDIELPSSLEKIGKDAFSDCYNLASAVVNNGVTYLSKWMFSGSDNLACCYIPESVKSGYDARITRNAVIYAPAGSEALQWFADNGYETVPCSRPEDMPVTEYVRENDMEFLLFRGEAALAAYTGSETEVSVPDNVSGQPVTRIRKYAFNRDKNVLRIRIPQTVKIVNRSAFYFEHWNPVDIYFSNPDTGIEEGAFARNHVRNQAAFILHAGKGGRVQQFVADTAKKQIQFEESAE